MLGLLLVPMGQVGWAILGNFNPQSVKVQFGVPEQRYDEFVEARRPWSDALTALNTARGQANPQLPPLVFSGFFSVVGGRPAH